MTYVTLVFGSLMAALAFLDTCQRTQRDAYLIADGRVANVYNGTPALAVRVAVTA